MMTTIAISQPDLRCASRPSDSVDLPMTTGQDCQFHVAARGSALAAALSVVSGGLTAVHARFLAPYQPRLEHIALEPAAGKSRDRAIRIAFVTDTHVGPVIRAADVERALRLYDAFAPDVLLLGGDLICESPRYIPEAAAVLGDFAGSLTGGAYAVLGNHDYSNDAPRLVNELERRGIRVLRNEAAPLGGRDSTLWVAGIDDALLGSPDLTAAFSGIPEMASAISLWHEPDWADAAAAKGAVLQISGHSHGGQVRLPGLGPAAAPTGGKRFVHGLNMAGSMPVYTSRGVGVYRPPVRFRCPPEVTLITVG